LGKDDSGESRKKGNGNKRNKTKKGGFGWGTGTNIVNKKKGLVEVWWGVDLKQRNTIRKPKKDASYERERIRTEPGGKIFKTT